MLFVTDFDGTLLNDQGFVSTHDISMLHRLGNMGFVRVIATGRSPYSLSKVIDETFPVDYVIFSTGAGIYEWKTKTLLYAKHIEGNALYHVAEVLKKEDLTFMVQHEIPENHFFSVHFGANHSTGTDNRLKLYENFYSPLEFDSFPDKVTQFLTIIPPDDHYFYSIEMKFKNVKVIKASSPLNDGFYWMEIFSEDVSKANAVKWIQEKFKMNSSDVMVLGNDYNDLDMLYAYEYAYVVKNAPDHFKKDFYEVSSNNENGFSEACENFLELKGL